MIFIFAACSDHNLQKSSFQNEGANPIIDVTPIQLHFGTCTQEHCFDNLRIENIGSGTLQIQSWSIEGSESAAFSIAQIPQNISLSAGESQDVIMGFAPISNQNTATVSIYSNDTSQERVDVSLSGQGLFPELQVIPNPLDMGDVPVGCTNTNQILLSNSGEIPLEIISITRTENSSFVENWTESLPTILEPSSYMSISIDFTPAIAGTHDFEFHIFSNTPHQVDIVPVHGMGRTESVEEIWYTTEAPKTDIMFSVDLSSSMSDEADMLAVQFQTFISQLSNYTTDWQVMVVNADHGCNHSGILTPNTPNYETIFSEAVRTGAYDISFTEALLTNVTRGTEKSLPGQCNDGFMRPDAMLHIIMLSDECEQSPNPGICGTQWQSYVDRVYAAKGDANLVRMSAIAGDYPNGCGNPQTAEFGSGYWESTIATGGVFLSICADWTTPLSLEQLATTSIALQEYSLSHSPIISSMEVFVDGASTTDWTYNPSTNSITLLGNYPPNSEIKTSYQYLLECE